MPNNVHVFIYLSLEGIIVLKDLIVYDQKSYQKLKKKILFDI